MTFDQANAIIKSTDNIQLREEAEAAFGIIYEQQPLCLTCARRLKCKMMSPLVYRCHFLQSEQEAEIEKALYGDLSFVNV